MVNIVRTHTRRNSMGGPPSPRTVEVGEIDTKAPFQSVKAALSLFGVPSSSPPSTKPVYTKKPKPQAQEVLDNEAQFHLALNELNKLKEQLRGAELKKNQTIPELDRAQRTLEDLQEKLKTVNESKQNILETSKTLKERARKLEEAVLLSDINAQEVIDIVKADVDNTKEEYTAVILELDSAKQQLSNVHREYEATLEAKAAALRLSQEADAAVDAHRLRVGSLTKQIATMQDTLASVKASSKNAEEDHHKGISQRNEEISSRRLAKQEMQYKMLGLQDEYRSLLADDLQAKLVETNAEILCLKEKVSNAKDVYVESRKTMNYELEEAKKSFDKVAYEKLSLQRLLESLKRELEHVGKELLEQKLKIEESETLANRLKAELDDEKNVLEAGLINKTSAADVSDDMAVTIEQLNLETEKLGQEAEQIKKRIREEEQQTQITKERMVDMETKLSSVLKEVEEARAANRAAQDEIKVLSDRTEGATDRESTPESNSGKIKVSTEEYNSLIEKVDESEKLADIKVTANIAQVEALVASQKEAARKYEAISKEIEEVKMKEEEALKVAEMAEAAKSALEAELQRMYQEERINQTPQVESNAESIA
ncbi:WEB family protein At1g12150-like [Amaranthus tricolor]|uniref:WEB family protein At1g12150-like n=1 Tax=Amaranthus tricolor TaxID=29722 RepID=UPI00258D654B|nr:WEB family protein At1g12150-like [Amaranthus tricolor]